MEFKDYYGILGVSRSATQDDIKRAYRKLARKYHPDVSKEADAEARFKEVGEAYEVLKDPEKRAAYDRLGSQWQPGEEFRPPPGWDGGVEFSGGGFTEADASRFSDFFESLFGHGHPEHTVRGTTFRMRGEDVHARLRVRLEEARSGVTRAVTLSVPEVDARGRVHTRSRTLNVRIPAGVTAGQQIRLAGQGAPGVGPAATAGDLYLRIEFEPHPLYRVDGRDVYLELPVTPWEAALGTQLAVPTLGGKVDLKIPAGSQSGRKLRLRGRGLPGQPAGDQYVVLTIQTPPANSERARELYRRMEQELAFNPRAAKGM